MFTLVYNLYKYCKKKSERKITLAVLGLDNAGKTTLVNTIKGEVDQETSPTFGFNSSTLQEGKYKLEVFDLGGGKTFRSVWSRYLAEVHGIVYVVDAADAPRFEESKKALIDMLESNFMRDKPVLIFANKQDLPSASTVAQVVDGLGLSTCRNSHNVMPCTAKTPAGASVDGRLRDGIRWLVGTIHSDFARMDQRVQADAEVVRQEEAQKKKERDERVRRQREERARLAREEEERAREVEKENALHDGKGAVLMAVPSANGQAGSLPPVEVAAQAAQQDPQQQMNGNGMAALPTHLGLALGLPHTIESPGKFPPPPNRHRPLEPSTTFDSAASISEPAVGGPTAESVTAAGAATCAGVAAPPAAARNPLPPLAPSNPAASASNGPSVRPTSANSRTKMDDGPAAAGFAAAPVAMASSTLTPSISTSLAARPPGSRPGSAGRGSAGSGGDRSRCSSPIQGAVADADAVPGAASGFGGEEEQAGGPPAMGLRPRALPPLSTGGCSNGSGGGASDGANRGSFSIVHQNKVVPVAPGLVAA